MKEWFCTAVGFVGAGFSWIFGGFDEALAALIILMAVDYLSGSIVALVFHNSRKTESGCYNSAYGLKGLCKKGLMLLFVLMAVQLDRMMDTAYIRDAVCIGLSANEVISVTENLGLAGIPMPKAISKALEQLHNEE